MPVLKDMDLGAKENGLTVGLITKFIACVLAIDTIRRSHEMSKPNYKFIECCNPIIYDENPIFLKLLHAQKETQEEIKSTQKAIANIRSQINNLESLILKIGNLRN